MPPSSTLIKAGGSYIEMYLDGSSALTGLKEFEARFRASQLAFSKLGAGINFGGTAAGAITSAMRRGLGNLLTGNTFANMFVGAGMALGRTVHGIFSGAFFARLSRQFWIAGRQLAMGGALATGVMAGLVALLVYPLKEFARAEQIMGRFAATFRDLAADADVFANDFAASIGQSVYDIRDQMAEFFSILRGQDMEPGFALELTKMLTQGANDLQAYFDRIQSTEEAMQVLTSAMAGMVVPVQRFGANIRVFNLEQEMMARGIKINTVEMKQQELTMARLGIVFEAMNNAGIIGQAAREVGTLSSRFRAARATTRDIAIAIGGQLAPSANLALQAFNALGDEVVRFTNNNGMLVLGLASSTVALTGFVGAATALGVVTLILGANFRMMQIAILSIGAPIRVAFGAIRLLGIALGGFVVAAQMAAIALRSLVSGFVGFGAVATLLFRVRAAISSVLVLMVRFVSGTLLSGILNLGRYMLRLGTAMVVAARVIVTSVAAVVASFAKLVASVIPVVIGAGRLAVALTLLSGAALRFGMVVLLAGFLRLVGVLGLAGAAARVVSVALGRVVLTAAASFFSTLATAVLSTASALQTLALTISQGLISGLLLVAKGVWMITTSAITAGITIVSSFVSVLLPLAAVGLAVAALGTAIYNLAPAIREVFDLGLRRAAATITYFMQLGREGIDVLIQGFHILREDAITAMEGVGNAIATGQIGAAVEMLWAFIKLEFLRGWSTIAPIWMQFGSWLLTSANTFWSGIRRVFAMAFAELAGIGMTVVNSMNQIGATISSSLQTAFAAIAGYAQVSLGDLTGMWDSSESAIVQMTGLIQDSLTVAATALLNVWDDITTAVERAAAVMRSMTGATDLEKDIETIDRINRIRQDIRAKRAQQDIEARIPIRQQQMAEVKAAKEAARIRIEEEQRLRQEKIDQMFSGVDTKALDDLKEAQKNFDELFAKLWNDRIAAGIEPGMPGVLEGFQKMIDGFFGNRAPEGGASFQSAAAFANVAKFGLGTPDLQMRQLNELTKIREIGEQQLRKNPVQIPQPVVGQ